MKENKELDILQAPYTKVRKFSWSNILFTPSVHKGSLSTYRSGAVFAVLEETDTTRNLYSEPHPTDIIITPESLVRVAQQVAPTLKDIGRVLLEQDTFIIQWEEILLPQNFDLWIETRTPIQQHTTETSSEQIKPTEVVQANTPQPINYHEKHPTKTPPKFIPFSICSAKHTGEKLQLDTQSHTMIRNTHTGWWFLFRRSDGDYSLLNASKREELSAYLQSCDHSGDVKKNYRAFCQHKVSPVHLTMQHIIPDNPSMKKYLSEGKKEATMYIYC